MLHGILVGASEWALPKSASYGYGTGSEEVLAEILARIARTSRVIRFPAPRAITEA